MPILPARLVHSNRAAWLRGVALAAVALTLPACATMPAEGVTAQTPPPAAAPDISSERDAMKLAARPAPAYPATVEENVVEEQFGVPVADPYRWLEDDVRNSEGVADWVAAQQGVTNAYLKDLPGKAQLKASMAKMFDYERFGVPRRAGDRYFYMRNDGLQNQSVLTVRDGLTGESRVLIDPNLWAKDGATALAEWSASDDGSMLAYAIQDGGSDWRTVKVKDGPSDICGRFELEPVEGLDAQGVWQQSISVKHCDQIESVTSARPTKRLLSSNQAKVLETVKTLLSEQAISASDKDSDAPYVERERAVSACLGHFQHAAQKHRSSRARETLQALVDNGHLTNHDERLRLAN